MGLSDSTDFTSNFNDNIKDDSRRKKESFSKVKEEKIGNDNARRRSRNDNSADGGPKESMLSAEEDLIEAVYLTRL